MYYFNLLIHGNNPSLTHFITGANMLGYFVASLFFLRFFTRTHDRLFAWFSAAFCMMALSYIGFLFVDPVADAGTWLFVVRFLSFILIIIGVAEKNRANGSRNRAD